MSSIYLMIKHVGGSNLTTKELKDQYLMEMPSLYFEHKRKGCITLQEGMSLAIQGCMLTSQMSVPYRREKVVIILQVYMPPLSQCARAYSIHVTYLANGLKCRKALSVSQCTFILHTRHIFRKRPEM